MALKAIVAADDFETEVPEPLRTHYKQTGDAWVLGIDGIDDHPSVKSLKTAHERVKAEKTTIKTALDAANAKVEAFGDLTPEQLEELRSKAETGKTLTKEELDQLVKDKFGVSQLKFEKDIDGLKKQLGERDASLAATTTKLQQVTIDTAIRDAAASKNIRVKAIPLVTGMAKDLWRLGEDGNPVAMKGDQIVSGQHGPLTMEEWVESLSAEHDYLFEGNRGAGDGSDGRRPAPARGGATLDLSGNNKNAIGKNLEAIRDGKITDFKGA